LVFGSSGRERAGPEFKPQYHQKRKEKKKKKKAMQYLMK
jgi:hypothetical protein